MAEDNTSCTIEYLKLIDSITKTKKIEEQYKTVEAFANKIRQDAYYLYKRKNGRQN